MNTEYQVIPARPLHPSDLAEIKIVSNLRKRTSILTRDTYVSQNQKSKRQSLVSKMLQMSARWLSPKLPHSSTQRQLARIFTYSLPSYIRNEIVSALASSVMSKARSLNDFNYSMDQVFALPTSEAPIITIVIPVHNNWWVTYRCLRALQCNSDLTPYEIVLVDDASTDQTAEALSHIRGTTLVRNKKNSGYLLSTNLGASQASSTSKYLVLLNNDTEPIDGWLDSLYESIEKDLEIAIVGSTLIYPNGILQEAGGQIFASGNAWNLGRGQLPTNNLFTFTREVDYCSAASVIVRKSFWVSINGFDTRYLPAYCEDSDLALTAWNKGLKVMFEPKSWVIHHEGLSHGKSTNSGLKKYQILNNQKLFAKWETDLRNHWEDLGVPRFEFKRESKGIVVVCDRQLPAIARDAGSIRTVQIIRHIQALGYHVILVCIDNSTTQLDLDRLQSSGVEVHRDLNDFYDSVRLRKERIKAIWTIRQEVYDFFAGNLNQIAPTAVSIADLMDIEYNEKYDKASGVSKVQLKIAEKATKIILVSEVEAQEFNEQSKTKKASVVWAEYEPQKSEIAWENSHGLLFIGGFRHTPNLEGIQWFADEVIPLLHKMGFKAPIRVVGSGLELKKIEELESKGLEMLGSQEDLTGIYLQSRVAIIPLLKGAGRKGKMGEALSFGIPVVSTSIGADGFSNIESAGVNVADTPLEMAKAIFELHEDPGLWVNASRKGKAYCELNLSSMAMRNEILQLLPREGAGDE